MRMNTVMRNHGRWRRRSRRGVSEVIATVLLIVLTLVAGVILWSFKVSTPSSVPTLTVVLRSGGANPVWGDPTDCQPWGYNLSSYPSTGMTGSALTTWLGRASDGPNVKSWYGQCGDGNDGATTGNYSALNTSEFIIATHTPAAIPLSEVAFTFVCNNASNNGGTTDLISGSLAGMTWYPGVTQVASETNEPLLGKCGTFDASSSTAANDLYSNRLGIYVPIRYNATYLENGDTFILYIHNGGYPLDFECVANAAGIQFSGETASNGCQHTSTTCTGSPPHQTCTTTDIGVPQLDYDDYHGAPPWCFTSQGACTIYLTYTGTPSAVLATIPVYALAPPSFA